MFGKEKIQKMCITETFHAAIKAAEKAILCVAKELCINVPKAIYSLRLNIKAYPVIEWTNDKTQTREFVLKCRFKLLPADDYQEAKVIVRVGISALNNDAAKECVYALVMWGDEEHFFEIGNLGSDPIITPRDTNYLNRLFREVA